MRAGLLWAQDSVVARDPSPTIFVLCCGETLLPQQAARAPCLVANGVLGYLMARPSASLQVQHRWLAQCNAMPHIRSSVHLLQRRRQWPCGSSATPPKAGLVCRCQSPPAAQTGKLWLAELPSAVQHDCQSTSFCFSGGPTLACTSSAPTALAGCARSQPLIHHSHSTPASLVSIRRKLLTRIFLRWRLQALLAAASHGTCNHNPGQPR